MNRRERLGCIKKTILAIRRLNLVVEFDSTSELRFVQHDLFAINKIKCKMKETTKGVYSNYCKNNIIGEWEMIRDKAIGIQGRLFTKIIEEAKNSEDKESEFHILPAEKKEKLDH